MGSDRRSAEHSDGVLRFEARDRSNGCTLDSWNGSRYVVRVRK
jgi:hypothetical protein